MTRLDLKYLPSSLFHSVFENYYQKQKQNQILMSFDAQMNLDYHFVRIDDYLFLVLHVHFY
jgi:hypothetical protein